MPCSEHCALESPTMLLSAREQSLSIVWSGAGVWGGGDFSCVAKLNRFPYPPHPRLTDSQISVALLDD